MPAALLPSSGGCRAGLNSSTGEDEVLLTVDAGRAPDDDKQVVSCAQEDAKCAAAMENGAFCAGAVPSPFRFLQCVFLSVATSSREFPRSL